MRGDKCTGFLVSPTPPPQSRCVRAQFNAEPALASGNIQGLRGWGGANTDIKHVPHCNQHFQGGTNNGPWALTEGSI